MTSDDQLAAVLAHEIEHVDRYHCAERVQVEARLRKLPLSRLIELPVALFQAGHTKEQEFEADREGTALIIRAGHSALGAVRMFETLDAVSRKEPGRRARAGSNPVHEASRMPGSALSEYFRSHPYAEERKRQIEFLMDHEGWPRTAERPPAVSPN